MGIPQGKLNYFSFPILGLSGMFLLFKCFFADTYPYACAEYETVNKCIEIFIFYKYERICW